MFPKEIIVGSVVISDSRLAFVLPSEFFRIPFAPAPSEEEESIGGITRCSHPSEVSLLPILNGVARLVVVGSGGIL